LFDISRILVAVDGSENSKKAAYYSLLIADRFKAQVIVLYVDIFRAQDVDSTPKPPQQDQSFLEEIKNRARQIDINLKTDIRVKQDSVVTEIVDYAKNKNVDLILIGIRGGTEFKFMLGSTASGVVTNAHCPVLVVK
jgi:nucleotide-binding universal stress UspA family protein